MNNLVIIGGGRWARQIMLSLNQNLKLKKIFCITNKKNFFLKKWLNKKKLSEIILISNNLPKSKSENSIAIICNSSSNHYRSSLEALRKGYNIFIEKPISLNFKQAEKIASVSKRKNKKIFCSNVFSYSESLKKITKIFKVKKITSIKLKWHDKIKERRYGEFKKIDTNVPIYLDVLFHIFFLLNLILKKKTLKISKIKKKVFSKNKAIIQLKLNNILIDLDFNRLGYKRSRLINVNYEKNEYLINFSNQKIFFTKKLNKKKFKKKYTDVSKPLLLMLTRVISITKNNRKVDNNMSINLTLKIFRIIENIINF